MPRGIYKRKPFTEKHKENIMKAKNILYDEHPELKQRISESMKKNQNAKGKRSESTKIKMSKSHKNLKLTEEHRKNMRIGLNNPKVIEENRKRAIKQWQNGSFDNHIKGQSKRMLKFWQDGIFDGVFKSPTKPEKQIIQMLESLRLKYIFQYRPRGYTKPFDFWIPERNLLIEYDSEYWHNLPGAKERDIEKTKYANENGYILLRFNEANVGSFQDIINQVIMEAR